MAHQYEIEIKSLLGSKDNADALVKKIGALDSNASCVATSRQLNHYFVGDDLKTLVENLSPLFPEDAQKRLRDIVAYATAYSVRTRQKDAQVLFIVKASVDDTTSENGISRIEFEEPVDVSLDVLDQKIVDAGFTCQAKWSREREEYAVKDVNVCLDKNAGYGYLAEFEKVIDDETRIEDTRNELRELMALLGAEELAQDRLERMFAHYNEHWPEYYGTDKVFTIE